MKVAERVMEQRIRKVVNIDEMQLGFMPGRGTIHGIFAIRQLIEKYCSVDKDLYMVFVDLEKAFDQVPREVIWWALRRKGVLEYEVKAVMEMYKAVKTAVKMEGARSDWFQVKVGVHQGSVLSPLLFVVVMDEVTKELRTDMREFLYADDVVILGDSWKEVSEKYKKWKKALEEKGMTVNIAKTKAMKLNGKGINNTESSVDPCGICGKRVMRNSIRCSTCQRWIHKRCSGVKQSLSSVKKFQCGKCSGRIVDTKVEADVRLGNHNIEVVTEFCYLGEDEVVNGGRFQYSSNSKNKKCMEEI
jgi:hypothetical protein